MNRGLRIVVAAFAIVAAGRLLITSDGFHRNWTGTSVTCLAAAAARSGGRDVGWQTELQARREASLGMHSIACRHRGEEASHFSVLVHR